MQRNLKNGKTPNTSKGITLVALVITIIVLLILAGVAINMAINSDGLFGKANEATEKWNESVEKEETAISDLLTELDKVSPMEVEISTDIPEDWDDEKVSAVATAGSRKAPIPVGFTVSSIEGENSIAGGLVIYQTGDVDTTVEGFWSEKDDEDDKYLKCQTTYNQYVWIPVDNINYLIMCQSNNVLADEDGNKTCNIKIQTDGSLGCENLGHTSTKTALCGRVYSITNSEKVVEGRKIRTRAMVFDEEERAKQTWNEASYYEPAVLGSEYDNDENTGDLETFTSQMTKDFTNMAKSVEKYGGFYLSRYEVGENGSSKRNQKVLVAASSVADAKYLAANKWYGLYNTVHNEITVGTSTIQSHMIYGCQYDLIINFIGQEAQVGHKERQLGTRILTGSNNADKMKNIYDLEGNHVEWTAQAYSVDKRAGRGGDFFAASGEGNTGGYFGPASNRYSNLSPTSRDSHYTTRSALYM